MITRGGNRYLVVLMVALLAIAMGSPSFVKAEENSSEEQVCVWGDEVGKVKCGEAAEAKEEDDELPNAEEAEDEYEDEQFEEDEIPNAEEAEDEYEEEPYEEEEEYEDAHKYRKRLKEDEVWDVWQHGTKADMYEALECPDYDYSRDDMFKDTSFENIHNTETWKTFNKVYNEVIAATKGDEELEQNSTIPEKFENNGFQFPIEIKFDPIVGRGVYAKVDIPKGSLLYISTNNAAFLNGQTYRNFLRALPQKLACDVLIWAFVRWVSLESEINYHHMVCVDLDEGSFVNSADDDDSYNMALGNDDGVLYLEATEEEERELWHGCKMKFYAYRDIKAGEEILAGYGDFAETTGWWYLGLQ